MNQNKKRVPFGQLIKQSFSLVWKNKFLWWFGLFLALGGGGMWQINYDLGGDSQGPEGDAVIASIQQFIQNNLGFVITGLIVFAFIAIALYFLRLAAFAALIHSVEALIHNKPAGFKIGMKEAKPFIWPLFVLNLIIFGIILITILALLAPGLYLLSADIHPASFIALFLGIIIFLPILIIFFYVQHYGALYLVLGKLTIRSSLDSAYKLFKANIGNSLIMGILTLLLQFALGIGLAISIVIAFIPAFLLGLLVYTVTGENIGAVVLYGIIMAIPFFGFVLWIQSVFQSFINTAWLLFFEHIARIEDEPRSERILEVEAPTKATAHSETPV